MFKCLILSNHSFRCLSYNRKRRSFQMTKDTKKVLSLLSPYAVYTLFVSNLCVIPVAN